ncbi:hypothetical protein [Streptomyces sp. IB2014 016-6]|uniref:hypothetical protein n=1 Tax=Streptomyces sp. IB2014 016-6 TaxID=2517818 RepID=UPI0011C84D87|nr:hypothetical protein [Streptomyces sp. IB2014 016-6]TXL87834.1 hypothetical protein EW053_20655 [Streptomyces sp. IB2014 016-6]
MTARRFFPTTASALGAARKTAVVVPAAVLVSYIDAYLVRASTGPTGWLFGTEFWLVALVLAAIPVLGWTDGDESWVRVFVLGALVTGAVAGPLLLFHGVLVALAAVPAVAVLGVSGLLLARTYGADDRGA